MSPNVLDRVLNAIIALSVAVFLAYVGLHYYDFGLFKRLPASIVEFFTRNGYLQYVALGVLIAAAIAKIPVGRALKAQKQSAETR